MTVEPRQFRPQPHFLLKVVGDSMIDAGIYENDLLVVHKTPEARSGQIVVARIDEEITVKELQRKGRRVELLAHNANYQPIVINPNQEFAIEGLAVGLIRSYSNAPTPLR
jgi:repressor LexA